MPVLQEETGTFSTESLKGEIKAVIKRDIQAGVLDSNTIKTNVKSFLKQRINEGVLQKAIPVPEKSFSGFVSNVKRNTEEIINGFGALVGMTVKNVINPYEGYNKLIDTTRQLIASPGYREEFKTLYVKPIVDEYKEYRDPAQKLYEDPLDVVLDVTALFSLGATASGKVGLTGTSKTLSVASTPLKASNLTNATKYVLRTLPKGDDIVKNLEVASRARKLLRKEQTGFIVSRNKLINDINVKLNALTSEEVKALPLAVEGFATVPQNASRAFHEALGMVRSLAKDQERFGLKIGALTPDIVERRRFQPLAKFLEGEGAIDAPRHSSLIPYENLTDDALRSYIGKIKEFFPEADPIYMRHFFEDNPKKFSSFFLNTEPVRSFNRPGFLKKSYGKSGYIGESGRVTKVQLKEVLTRQATENLKWQKNMELIENLKSSPDVKPYRMGDELLPDHAIFAPDGMIRFYKGSIDLHKELQKAAQNLDVWDAFQEGIKNSFPKTKNYLGVGRAKLYQVPKAMAQQLNKLVKSSNPYIKLFWDKPLDAFRFSVLGFYPRWQFNNVVGNAIFSTIKGDVFNPKAFFMYRQARKSGLFPDELFGGVHRIERTTSGRLGAAADTPFVRSTVAMHDKMLDTRVIGKVVSNVEKIVKKGVYNPIVKVGNFSFKVNQSVDDFFKGVAFINESLKESRKGFISRMVTSFDDSLKSLEKVRKSPLITEKLVDNVHKWYYHGLNLTDFERRVVRRVIPFYSWLRWSTLYAFRIGTEAPVRANVIAKMSKDFYMFTGQNKLPERLKGAVPIGNDDDGTVYYLTTKGVNIFEHLNTLMNDGVSATALQSSAPGIKTLVEQATGRDAFLGIPFTRQRIGEYLDPVTSRLYKFDPETGDVKEIEEKIKPALMENLLRNYIPQYILLETLLAGGNRRYTAEGLDTILKDLFKDPEKRQSVVKDIITLQPKEVTRPSLEFMKALGINIKEVKPESEAQRQESLERATSAIINREIPILNPKFKTLLKLRIIEELGGGATREEAKENIKVWIGINVEKLKLLK